MSYKQIAPNIYAVGAFDPDIRNFHGYLTPHGSTYNAYLILDDKKCLVDTVKRPFTVDLIDNIRALIPLEEIDYIVCNHIEPDHSGALPTIAQLCPKATVVCTTAAEKGLRAYYKADFRFQIVGAGDTLSLGQKTLHFFPMPMVHWPDSMSTYVAEDALLFSNDAFGQHIGRPAYFDSELGWEILLERATDYYANIVLPFGMPVSRILGQLQGKPLSLIAPSHGVCIKDNIAPLVEKYNQWATGVTDPKKAVIAFDTMWGATKSMAEEIEYSLRQKGYEVTMFHMSATHVSTVMASVLDASYIALGSPTLNKQVMPTMAALLSYMKGLAPKKRLGRAFGAYGWSGESVGQIETMMQELDFTLETPLKALWRQ